MTRMGWVLLLLLLTTAGFVAQRPDAGPAVIRVDSNLVTVPVSVTDPLGRIVTNLQSSDFSLEEDGRPEAIAKVAEPGETRLRLALIFDLSGSVRPRFEFEQQAATRFVKKVLSPGDSVAIIALGSESRVILPETESLSQALAALSTLEPTQGSTAFYDAVALGARLLRSSSAPETRRVEVVISDGEDNNSENTSLSDALKQLQQADGIFYSINPAGPSIRLNVVSLKGQSGMEQLASETGGTAFIPDETNDLEEIFGRIAAELKAQYLLEYYPSNPDTAGVFRKISVRVPKQPQLRIRSRQGYYVK